MNNKVTYGITEAKNSYTYMWIRWFLAREVEAPSRFPLPRVRVR